MATALQKINLLNKFLSYDNIKQTIELNDRMRASFNEKAKKMEVDKSALEHEDNFKEWLKSQKKKMEKTKDQILLEIAEQRALFGIDDQKFNELTGNILTDYSITDSKFLGEEYKKSQIKIQEWIRSKNEDLEFRKLIEELVIKELKNNVPIMLYSMEPDTFKLQNIDQPADDSLKDFIKKGVHYLTNTEIHQQELKDFLTTFSGFSREVKRTFWNYNVENGHINMIKFLMENGQNPAHLNPQILIKLAVNDGNHEIAEFFLSQQNLTVNPDANFFSNIFNIALSNKDSDMIKLLIKNERILGNKYKDKGTDVIQTIIDIMREGDYTEAFYLSVSIGIENVVEYFLYETDVYEGVNKITPLEFAIQNNHDELLRILLEKEKNSNGKEYISNLLKLAMEKQSYPTINMLLNKENPNFFPKNESPDLVILAIENGHPEVANFLLDRELRNGIQRDNFFKYPSEKMAKFLLENRKLSKEDFLKSFEFAIQNNNIELVKYLLEKDENLGIQTNEYDNFLLSSFEKNNFEACNLLIRKGVGLDMYFQDKPILSLIVGQAMVHEIRPPYIDNPKMKALCSALNENDKKIKKLDLSKIFQERTDLIKSISRKNIYEFINSYNFNLQNFFIDLRLCELEELDLSDNFLNISTVKNIKLISPKLKRLNLAGNDFFHRDTSSINLLFKELSAIEDLDLSRNNIDFKKERKIKTFIDWLSQSRTLQKLNLSENATEDNAVFFCEIIKQNKLKELDISNNNINEEDIRKIATFLRDNTSLIKLDLSKNTITQA